MIIYDKNYKGGIGKSTIAKNLSAGLAAYGKQVALITFDKQNDSLKMLGTSFEDKKGFKAFVTKREDIKIKVRENLDYFPLETTVFGKTLKPKLIEAFKELEETYDFIVIDGAPASENVLDEIGHEVADKVLTPITLDRFAVEGLLSMIDHGEKIDYIVPNLFRNTAKNRAYYDELTTAFEGTGIFVSKPIPQTSLESELADKGNSIFETASKKATDTQEIYLELIGEIING